MSDPLIHKKQHVGIRAKLVASLIIFTMFVLISIWVLQIKLLAYFYERAKFEELEVACDEIVSHFGEADFVSQMKDVAQSNGYHLFAETYYEHQQNIDIVNAQKEMTE